jgi:HEPN domain-containing protein
MYWQGEKVNVDKQVAHWLNSAKEDLEVAGQLIDGGKYRHGLFFIHLSIEKVLKAIYTKRLAQVPPKLHALDRLVELCGLQVSDEQTRIMARINAFNLEGRYPEQTPIQLDRESATGLKLKAEEVYQWLIKQL